jgi:hypothetical protein
MVAGNVLRGDHPVVHWDAVDWEALRADPQAVIVDVREVRHAQWAAMQSQTCCVRSFCSKRRIWLATRAVHAAQEHMIQAVPCAWWERTSLSGHQAVAAVPRAGSMCV